MRALIRANAKAIAALVAPFIVALLVAMIEAAGLNVAFDPTVVEQTIVAVVSFIVVWLTTNTPKGSP
jgi:hypothetical protein